VELRQLAHFVAVPEELHFSRAATRVHVVQSSLSASIHTLEREVGAALFVRDSRSVMLTQAGRALLPAARRALAAADEGRDAVAGVRGVLRGQLHVGAIQTLGVIDLPALLTALRRAHPGVTIRLRHLRRRRTRPAHRLRGAEHAVPRRTRPARARHFGAAPDEPARSHRTRLDHPHHAAATPRHLRGRRRHAPTHRSRTSPARRRRQRSTRATPHQAVT
jgi:DNA-binding transcriptional LysR family regulator